MFERVAIVGVGLIGGSLGLEIRKKKLAKQVIGYGRSRGNLNAALKIGAIDRAAANLEGAVFGADLVLLCGPVSSIIDQLKGLSGMVHPGALVMDVGSTKREIVRASRFLPSGVSFVAAHPMAGTEQSGASHARLGLFQKKTCLITPVRSTSRKALNKAVKLWKELGCKVTLLSPERHDQTLAATSHLPQMAAYALMAPLSSLPLSQLKLFSGSGLKDTTRIAASPASMWRDIVLTNAYLPPLLNRYAEEIKKISTAITRRKGGELEKIFSRASRLRKKLG
ncbi:MAG: prephenate dehydrogenase/arogenate dehydrogenase family protein [Deltaproteobacteria bacterium]|nr:prephenate dehydrogenase/arogenate dehydrogenase family protein [Deltaproteobacteria bacterium]